MDTPFVYSGSLPSLDRREQRLLIILLGICFALFYISINQTRSVESVRFSSSNRAPLRYQFAYATSLYSPGSNCSIDDPAVVATRTLCYQIIHRPDTRTQGTPCLVLVTPDVPISVQYTLLEEGATIIRVNSSGSNYQRPESQLVADPLHLHELFKLSQFKRILYLGRDSLLDESLESIWEETGDDSVVPTLGLVHLSEEQVDTRPTRYYVGGYVSRGRNWSFAYNLSASGTVLQTIAILQ